MRAVAAICLLFATVGCGVSEADCTTQARVENALYVNRAAAPADDLNAAAKMTGEVQIVDCGSVESAPTLAEVDGFAFRDLDPRLAFVVTDADWSGVYVAKTVPKSDWPTALRELVEQ